MSGILQFVTLPIQKIVSTTTLQPTGALSSQQQLQQENNDLRTQLAHMQEVQKDNQALHDQFLITNPQSQKLLPADVVGIQQNALFIDKGESDNVYTGEVVVVKNNLETCNPTKKQ